jgi:hypothetical protein
MRATHWAVIGGLVVSLGLHLQGASSWGALLQIKSVGELLVQLATVLGALALPPPTPKADAA